MQVALAIVLKRIDNGKGLAAEGYLAGIAHLTPHFCVEGSLRKEEKGMLFIGWYDGVERSLKSFPLLRFIADEVTDR